MSWIFPGEPWTEVIEGVEVKFRPLTWKERQEIANQISDVSEGNVEAVYDALASAIQSINGREDVGEILTLQNSATLRRLIQIVISGGLTDDDLKNLQSSPVGKVATAPTVGGDTSNASGTETATLSEQARPTLD